MVFRACFLFLSSPKRRIFEIHDAFNQRAPRFRPHSNVWRPLLNNWTSVKSNSWTPYLLHFTRVHMRGRIHTIMQRCTGSQKSYLESHLINSHCTADLDVRLFCLSCGNSGRIERVVHLSRWNVLYIGCRSTIRRTTRPICLKLVQETKTTQSAEGKAGILLIFEKNISP